MTAGDWDRRQLCPDGACVGVIDDNGTCKVCGRAAPNWGEERKRGLATEATEDDEYEDDEEDEDDDEDEDEIAPSAPAVIGQNAGWNERTLCPDGACVGVIGDDGKCRVCGRLAPEGSRRRPAVANAPAETEPAPAAAAARTRSPDDVAVEPPEIPAVDDLEAERKLCPDGACVGVIGPDGTCKLCGKAAA